MAQNKLTITAFINRETKSVFKLDKNGKYSHDFSNTLFGKMPLVSFTWDEAMADSKLDIHKVKLLV